MGQKGRWRGNGKVQRQSVSNSIHGVEGGLRKPPLSKRIMDARSAATSNISHTKCGNAQTQSECREHRESRESRDQTQNTQNTQHTQSTNQHKSSSERENKHQSHQQIQIQPHSPKPQNHQNPNSK